MSREENDRHPRIGQGFLKVEAVQFWHAQIQNQTARALRRCLLTPGEIGFRRWKRLHPDAPGTEQPLQGAAHSSIIIDHEHPSRGWRFHGLIGGKFRCHDHLRVDRVYVQTRAWMQPVFHTSFYGQSSGLATQILIYSALDLLGMNQMWTPGSCAVQPLNFDCRKNFTAMSSRALWRSRTKCSRHCENEWFDRTRTAWMFKTAAVVFGHVVANESQYGGCATSPAIRLVRYDQGPMDQQRTEDDDAA